MNVLVANIGSTSFKYRVIDTVNDVSVSKGRIERIAETGGYNTAITNCLKDLPVKIDAVGFKAVHAGSITGAQRIDDNVLQAMEEYSFLAPAHNPPYIAAMKGFLSAFPALPLVALFETAFFSALPEAASRYAAPFDWKIRRFGFHGASHRAAAEYVQRMAIPSKSLHISCHLGGSSSLAAIRDGVAVDCSFGMSPQSGLPQNNRAGDIDVFAILYVMKKEGIGIDEMASILCSKSGLAGLSGTSGDIRDINDAIARGSARAKLALDVYVRAIRHYLGAFLLELGGLDVLTFSGGIGENSPEIRQAVCENLGEFGIVLDEAANLAATGENRISAGNSRTAILVVPADEERIVARAVAELLC